MLKVYWAWRQQNNSATKIGDGKIVAVTGGSTIAAIPSHIEKFGEPDHISCSLLLEAVLETILAYRQMSLQLHSQKHVVESIERFIIQNR